MKTKNKSLNIENLDSAVKIVKIHKTKLNLYPLGKLYFKKFDEESFLTALKQLNSKAMELGGTLESLTLGKIQYKSMHDAFWPKHSIHKSSKFNTYVYSDGIIHILQTKKNDHVSVNVYFQ